MAKINYLNGRRFSHSSGELTVQKGIGGPSEIFIDYDSVDYGDGLEMAFVRGANRGPIGVTAGDYEANECNISMGKSSFQFGIVVALGDGWMGTECNITLSYNDKGEPLCTDRVKGWFLRAEDSSAVGAESVRTKLVIKAAWVSRNGIFPLKNMIK